MISCKRHHLAARCRQRGYTLEEVAACVVSEDGDALVVDETHPAYPAGIKPGHEPPIKCLAGTSLKSLLGRFGITASAGCSCTKRAREMDSRGCEWCEAHLDEIVGWLREEAAKRGLPFLDAAGRVLVRRAIANARKEAARARGSQRQD